MNRLRSSPQGSVLGALNALFSPHQVTGAPTPQQAASQGLLGRMVSAPGNGGALAGSGSNSSPLAQALAQNQNTTDTIRQNLTGTGPQNVDTTDSIRQNLIGSAPGNVATTDTIRRNLTGAAPGDVSTTDTINQKLAGSGAKNTATTNVVREKLDPATAAKTEKDVGDSGKRSGTSFFAGFGLHMGPFFAGLTKSFGDSGNKGGAALGAGLLGGIGPGILGIGTMVATKWVAGIGTVLAALPALVGIVGLGMGTALIGGTLAGVVAGSKELKGQFTSIAAEGKSMFAAAGSSLIPVLHGILAQVPALIKGLQAPLAGIFKTIGPQLQGVFQGIIPIVTGLVKVMQAAAPAFGPFIEGLEKLVSNIFPGLETVIKATVPFVSQIGGLLSTLGSNLGSLFATAAPAIGASMKVLSDLLGVVGGLLPVIMQLADVFAKALAPVFAQLGAVIVTLEPTLLIVGKIISELAGAIIGDLVSAFGALATLATAAAPGLNILATALGQVFTVLENTGVFAILGDALENLAAPLGSLITALAKELAPILPPIISFIGDMAALIASTLSGAIVAILPSLTKLAVTVLGALVRTLPQVLPLLGTMAGLFSTALVDAVAKLVPPLLTLATTVLSQMVSFLPTVVPALVTMLGLFTPALVTVIGGIVTALADIVTAIPPSVLTALALGIGGIALAFKLWAGIGAVVEGVGFAIGVLEGTTVTFVIGSLTEAATLAAGWVAASAVTIASFVATAAAATAAYIAENIASLGIIAGITLLVAAVVYLATHWTQVWGDIQTVTKAAWTWLVSNVFDPMETFFTVTLSGWLTIAAAAFTAVFVAPVEAAFRTLLSALTTVGDSLDTLFTHTIPGYWDAAYTAIVNTGTTIINWFKALPGNIVAALGDLGTTLLNFGKSIMDDMLTGIKDIWTSIVSFFKGLPGDILSALGINSPPGWAIQAGKDIIEGVGIGMKQAQGAYTTELDKLNAATQAAANGKLLAPTGSGATVMELMKSMAASVGWTGAQWTALNAVEMREAGYDLTATNPSSGAYGLAQFINGPSEYAQYGGNSTTAAGQITAMINYIAQRYGEPSAALDHEIQYNWYGQGGVISEPVIGYGAYTGRGYVFGENGSEQFSPLGGTSSGGGGQGALLAKLDQLISVASAIPAGVGDQVGGAIGSAAKAASFRTRYPAGGA